MATILNDGQAGYYTESGAGWFTSVGGIYGNGSARAHAAGTGGNTATWQVSGLAPGAYLVQATWKGYSDQASNATFSVYDGNTLLGAASVNQKLDPTGQLVNGATFQTLVTAQVASGTLRVEAGRAAIGYLGHEPLVYRELTALENLELY